MRRGMPIAALMAFVLLSAPGRGQEREAGPLPAAPGGQTITQEAARNPGTPLFVGPATVRRIQQALNQAGYDAGHVEGRWTEETRRAAMNFQQANGLEPTGTVTLGLLQALGITPGEDAR